MCRDGSREKCCDVLHLLKLGDQGDALFHSPAVHAWASFAIKLDEKRAGEMMLQSLEKVTLYDEARLVNMLLAAKASSDTKTLATRIEDALLATWGKDKSVDGVFRLLKLDDEGTKFLDSP